LFTVNRNPTADDLLRFGCAMVLGFSLIAALAWCAPWLSSVWRGAGDTTLLGWRGAGGQMAAIGFVALGVSLWILSMASTGLTKKVYVAWMSVTVPCGVVMGTVMLSLVFLLVLPVFSLIVRWGDPMRKRLFKGGTYWESAKPFEASLERMRRLF